MGGRYAGTAAGFVVKIERRRGGQVVQSNRDGVAFGESPDQRFVVEGGAAQVMQHGMSAVDAEFVLLATITPRPGTRSAAPVSLTSARVGE